MPELLAPGALVGLSLLPLVRWLHLFHDLGRVYRVAALFLWRDPRAAEAPGERSRRPDPAWRRRAALAGLLVLALARPSWTDPAPPPVQVWWDRSRSMDAREGGTTRHRIAADRLMETAGRLGQRTIEIRPLRGSGPALPLGSPGEGPGTERILAWLAEVAGGPAGALPGRLEAGVEHWLVSDGADSTLGDWLARQPVSQVIQVGTETENLTVTGLSIRASLTEPAGRVGMVEARNAGLRPARARLSVATPAATLAEFTLELPPGAAVRRRFDPSGASEGISATLERLDQAPDALPSDDSLTLDPALPEAAPRVRVTGTCGPEWNAAVIAHPGLAPAPPEGAHDLAIACTPEAPPPDTPALWLRRMAGAPPVDGPRSWSPEAGALQDVFLDPRAWSAFASETAGSGTVLLRAADRPVMILHTTPARQVEARLATNRPLEPGDPTVPLLLSGLADLLMERDLLARHRGTRRDAAEARIAPRDLAPTVRGRAHPDPAVVKQDLTPWVLALATMLAAADLILLLRRPPAEAPRP